MIRRKFLLFPSGTGGDIYPFVGMANELTRRGHEVAIFANGHFRELVSRHGLDFSEISPAGAHRDLVGSAEFWTPGLVGVLTVADYAIRQMPVVYDVVKAHAREPGVRFVGNASAYGLRVAEERLGIWSATVQLAPAFHLSVHQPPRVPGLLAMPLMPTWQRRLYLSACEAFGDGILEPVNEFRAGLGLPRARRLVGGWVNSPNLTLVLCPQWYAGSRPDWPGYYRFVGFPLYDEADLREVPEEAEAFLQSCEQDRAPIVASPGTAVHGARRFFEAVTAACRYAERPGVLLTEHRGQIPEKLPPNVRHFDYVPLSRILARAGVLVSHGGVGTVAQGLAAGVPQLIRPMVFDQYDNAWRVTRFGVGRMVHEYGGSGVTLAGEVEDLTSDLAVKVRCAAVARLLEGEDGIGGACAALCE